MTNNFSNRHPIIISENNKRSFTLIELLVVLALVAILSVVVVMTLNPAELLKQARDSNRLSDLATINTSLNLFASDVTNGFMGTSTVVYISIPDNASSTCGSLGLPTLPTGYTYNCVTTANLRNTDGSGWIPVNFQRISSNSPISQLPIDPQNTTSTKYYTYVTGGSWKLIAALESQKYIATAGTDGGTNIGQFEVGNDMSLAPFTDSLVGWWKFDGNLVDSSGYGADGTGYGDSTYGLRGTSQAKYFNGSDTYVDAGSHTQFDFNNNFTLSSWVYATGFPWTNYGCIFAKAGGAWNSGNSFSPCHHSAGTNLFVFIRNPDNVAYTSLNIYPVITNSWWHMVYTFDSGAGNFYVNGAYVSGHNASTTMYATNSNLYFNKNSVGSLFNGYLDDMRVYNRVLSTTEITSLYNATR